MLAEIVKFYLNASTDKWLKYSATENQAAQLRLSRNIIYFTFSINMYKWIMAPWDIFTNTCITYLRKWWYMYTE